MDFILIFAEVVSISLMIFGVIYLVLWGGDYLVEIGRSLKRIAKALENIDAKT